MTLEIQHQEQPPANRQPSDQLRQAVKECAFDFRKLKDSIDQTLELGRSEGFTDIETGRMIKAEMLANNYSIRTVQRYLPATAKESPKIPIVSSDNLSLEQLAVENYQVTS